MNGFIVISKIEDDHIKISAVEGGLTVAEAIQMLQLATQFFTTQLIQESIKQQVVKGEHSEKEPKKSEASNEHLQPQEQ